MLRREIAGTGRGMGIIWSPGLGLGGLFCSPSKRRANLVWWEYLGRSEQCCAVRGWLLSLWSDSLPMLGEFPRSGGGSPGKPSGRQAGRAPLYLRPSTSPFHAAAGCSGCACQDEGVP